jgi:hypothetical protein
MLINKSKLIKMNTHLDEIDKETKNLDKRVDEVIIESKVIGFNFFFYNSYRFLSWSYNKYIR